MTTLICLTYDDALPVHREFFAPELAKRGLRGTFYIPAARDDLHEHLGDWRRVAKLGHELGNHSCFHPCRTRLKWDWKPSYHLEEYTRARAHHELLLANRILHLIDCRTKRSYGVSCSELTLGNDESFVDDIRDLFTMIRSGHTNQHIIGTIPFVGPAWFVDFRCADEVIYVIESMQGNDNA